MNTQLNFIIKYPEGCESASNIYDAEMKARILVNSMRQMGWQDDKIKVNITSWMNPHWSLDFFIKRGELKRKEYDPNPIINKRDLLKGIFKFL